MEDENGVYEGPQATTYGYDQLNRLVSSIAYTSGNTMRTGNDWLGLYETDAYKTSYSYDANGNIMKLTRKDNNGQAMDNFTYNYKSTNNQLLSVSDDVDNAAKKLGDIQPGQSAENYKYDGIGNLIEDKQEEIKNIAWQANGKVKSVTRTPISTKPDLEFKYDALGQRVAKIVKPKNDNGELLPESEWETTWYVRDAQGNEMGIYKQKYTPVGTNIFEEELKIEEFSIYGSSRLGTASPKDNLLSVRRFSGAIDNQTKRFSTTQTQSLTQLSFNPNIVAHYRGTKQYHLSNHLGNVLATVSDRLIPESTDGLTVSGFKAEVVSASDYYPFGAIKNGRSYNLGKSRYGFNGQEKVDQWSEGNYDLGARFYSSRLGRMFSTDPRELEYPWQSTYAYFGNSPIGTIDFNGEGDYYDKEGKHRGNDGVKDDKTYVTTLNALFLNMTETKGKDGKRNYTYDWNGVKSNEETIDLNISHKEFATISNIVKHESSGDKTESLWIAHTANNRSKSVNKSLYKLLMTSYSSALDAKVPMDPKSNSNESNYARAASIDVLIGGADPTNNSEFWDGTDFIAWGLNSIYGNSHAKFRQYENIFIDIWTFHDFQSSQTNRWGSSVTYRNTSKQKVKFNIPSDVFIITKNPLNWGSYSGSSTGTTFGFYYKNGSGKGTLNATGAHGESIFWRVD